MPTGHFSIGDLSFSYEGSLKELAHCQRIQREISRAERRLRRASGSDRVVLIYDTGLEGERGTFDKLRLRAYDSDCNYTLDIGNTDENPFGVYVGGADNITVYNRTEEREEHEITPDGEKVQLGGSGVREGSRSSSGESASEAGSSEIDPQKVASTVQALLSQKPESQALSETILDDGPAPEKIRTLASLFGRDEDYVRRVAGAIGFQSLEEITVGTAEAVVECLSDPNELQSREQSSAGGDLPI